MDPDVRRFDCELLGTTTDLTEFMFGSERAQLGTIRDVLLETGPSRCFYCDKEVPGQTSNVDHFVPWARYPVAELKFVVDEAARAALGDRRSITSDDLFTVIEHHPPQPKVSVEEYLK